MTPVLEVWDLGVSYPDQNRKPLVPARQARITIIDGVTFQLAPGTTLGLVGESGSGKSTLAQAVLGLAPISSGHVLMNGHLTESIERARHYKTPWRDIRRNIGVTFQDAVASLDPRMTIGDSIAEPFRVHRTGGKDLRAEAARLLQQVGLSPELMDRYPHEISGGQARRVSVARAVALKPRLLIADEPTAGLDLSVQGELLNLLVQLQAESGLSLLLITHNLPVARLITDRIAIMYLGRIVEIGPTQAVFNAPRHPYTRALITARGAGRLPGDPPSLTQRPSGCEFHTRCVRVQPLCRTQAPARLAVSDAHQASCHFPLNVAQDIPLPPPTIVRPSCPVAEVPPSGSIGAPPDDAPPPSRQDASTASAQPMEVAVACSRMSRRRLISVLGAGAVVTGGVALAGSRRAVLGMAGNVQGASGSKILRIQNDGDLSCLDPANRSGWYDQVVANAIFCGLCQFDGGAGWTWSNDAAQTLERIDERTIAFSLKEGLHWTGDYGEVTAQDVKYSYERFADPRVQSVYRADWAALDRVETTGRYSGVIHLKHPDPALFASTLPDTSGLIVCKAALEKAGGRIRIDPLATCGPYRLEHWEPRAEIILARHEGWTGPAPYYDEIRLKVIEDKRVAHFAFDAGDLDMAKVEMGDIASVGSERDRRVNLTVRPSLTYTFMGLNVENEKLRDIRVRRAIQQALDPQALIDATFGKGLVTRSYGLVPPALPGARRRLIHPYDPAQAKRLLKEAGVDGLDLTLTFSNKLDYTTLAQAIQAQLAAVGIRLRLSQGDGAAQIAQQQDAAGGSWREMELFLVTNSSTPDPGSVTTWYTCDQVGHWNWSRACSLQWDALNAAAAIETDPVKRQAMYVTLQDALEESGGYVFLYHGVNAWVTRSTIRPSFTADGERAILRNMKSM